MKTRTVIQIIFLAVVGLTVLLIMKWTAAGIVVLSLDAVILAGSLFIPGFAGLFERFSRFLVETFSTILSWLLLTPIYYLIFTPVRLILLLRKRDPLNRKFPGKRASYWIPVEREEIPDRYRKQF